MKWFVVFVICFFWGMFEPWGVVGAILGGAVIGGLIVHYWDKAPKHIEIH